MKRRKKTTCRPIAMMTDIYSHAKSVIEAKIWMKFISNREPHRDLTTRRTSS